jgi:hypothetical protein
MSTTASDYTVMVNGNLSCSAVAVADLGGGQASLSCTPPDLPAGTYNLTVMQQGRGLVVERSSRPSNAITLGECLLQHGTLALPCGWTMSRLHLWTSQHVPVH